LRNCHLVYLGVTDRERATSILGEVQGAAVLTVSNGPDFVRLGGIVGLFVDEGRMRFAINPEAAQRAGLRLSSRLLQLAKILNADRHDQP
ncbi:MAG TPA: YfiR family protein, partial [Vicinamibacterales bacterium]|nr:YfiR family protein [Vicinamibacterales bacterium]